MAPKKAVIKLGTTTYSLQTPEVNYRDEVSRHQTDDERLQARIDSVTLAHTKAAKTRRKAVTGGCSRKYPYHGETMSTRDYVKEFWALNHGAFSYVQTNKKGHTEAVSRWMADFFQPLSTRITPIEGSYSEELESCSP